MSGEFIGGYRICPLRMVDACSSSRVLVHRRGSTRRAAKFFPLRPSVAWYQTRALSCVTGRRILSVAERLERNWWAVYLV